MMDQNKHGPLQVGDKFLNKYEVRGMLGRGGYAYVYECVDLFLGRTVALKIFKPVTSGPTDVERQAQKEARALLLVSDDRLVKLIDAGAHEGLVYLVMEKLNGRTLRDTLREVGRLTVPEALYIMLQVARALAAAHRAGVIHRDVKPENIFIEADLSVKLLDLGIAKVQGIGAQTTHKDGLRGTVLYMAPEQLQGHGATPRTDIYAMGVCGYEMMFRHHLYLGDAPPAYEEAAWRQISFVPPMLDELDPKIPHYVAKFMFRLLLKAPEQRYESMDHVIDLLLGLLKRLEADWAPQGKFILRPLHVPLNEQSPPSAKDAARIAAAISRQVTVKAPLVPAGDTEPFSKQPFSEPGAAPTAFSVSAPASGLTGAVAPASDRNKAPSSSEKPTVWTTPRPAPAGQARSGSQPPGSGPIAQTSTAPLKPSSPPAPTPITAAIPSSQQRPANTRDSSRDIVPPGTPPPVASGVGTRAVAVLPPFFRDPVIRLAGIAAVVFGVVAGTGYGWIRFAGGRAAEEKTNSAVQVVPTAEQALAPTTQAAPTPPISSAAEPEPELPQAPVPNAVPTTVPAPQAALGSPSPAVAVATPSPAPRPVSKASASTKARDPLMPSDEEIKRRMELLRSDMKSPPSSAAAPAPSRQQPRSSGSSIF